MDYVIGDIHGCYDQLMHLLDAINYDESQDCLWFTGDFINRGPDSLAVLRFVSSLKTPAKAVLGNHDLHFLACYYGNKKVDIKFKTYHELSAAHDINDIAQWLINQPLAIYDQTFDVLLTHAGICPSWSLQQALKYAQEVEQALKCGNARESYFNYMYGNEPVVWSEDLKAGERLRIITNYLTRMRYLAKDSQQLLLQYNSLTDDQNAAPWFEFIPKKSSLPLLLFGHWAALEGQVKRAGIIGLDTACYYGKWLTALCLQTKKKYKVAGYDFQT